MQSNCFFSVIFAHQVSFSLNFRPPNFSGVDVVGPLHNGLGSTGWCKGYQSLYVYPRVKCKTIST